MASFVIPLEDIDEHGKPYRFAVTPAWLGTALGETGLRPTADATDGTLEVEVQRSNADILVRGRVKTCFATDCARCLEDAVVTVDADVTTLFVPESRRPKAARPGTQPKAGASAKDRPNAALRKPTRASKAAAPDEEDLDLEGDPVEFYSGDDLVLDGIVREAIVLEEPMQPLCRPDCPGIPVPEGVRPPADFGREEGVSDPRLAPLLGLKQKLKRA